MRTVSVDTVKSFVRESCSSPTWFIFLTHSFSEVLGMLATQKSSKFLLRMTLLAMGISMVACTDSSGGKVPIGFAPRSAANEKLFQCVNTQVPKAVHTVVGKEEIIQSTTGMRRELEFPFS